MEERVSRVETRVDLLEKDVKLLALSNVRYETNQQFIMDSLQEIKTNVKGTEEKLASATTWGVRLVLGALALAILNFIIGGGLTLI